MATDPFDRWTVDLFAPPPALDHAPTSPAGGGTLAAWAVLSDCGRYRYILGRWWADGPRVLWAMLNPSTADATEDDPTIRRCVAFSRREGFGSLEVVNLLAWRATKPADLPAWAEAEGPDNDRHTREAAARASRVIVAWGTYMHIDRAHAGFPGVDLWCLGTTKDGHPRHPLYVRGDQPLVRWP